MVNTENTKLCRTKVKRNGNVSLQTKILTLNYYHYSIFVLTIKKKYNNIVGNTDVRPNPIWHYRSPPIGANANDNAAHVAHAGAPAANRPPQGPQGAPNHSSSSAPNHPPVNFCDIMSVFEKAVTEVRQGQEAFHNNLNNTNNSPPERDITYFNRTLVSTCYIA